MTSKLDWTYISPAKLADLWDRNKLFTVGQAAHALGDISHVTVYLKLKQRKLASVVCGKRRYITRASVAEYLKRKNSGVPL
jgi:excisionase family DNA binding protein